MFSARENAEKLEELRQVATGLQSENEQMISTFLEKVNYLAQEVTQVNESSVNRLSRVIKLKLFVGTCK